MRYGHRTIHSVMNEDRRGMDMALYLIEFSVVSYGKVIPERPFGLYTEDIVEVESSGNVPV
jgi:hypothetical protein